MRAVLADSSGEVIREIATAGLVAVSVGPENLPSVFPGIASGLWERRTLYGDVPLDIIIAENMRNAGTYFTDHLIYPIGFNLVSFAFSPVLALLWIPLSWVLPALVAYNVLFLLTIVLACLAMDQLVRYLTGHRDAAFLAGLVFGFFPYHLTGNWDGQMNLANVQWLPLFVLFLLRTVKHKQDPELVSVLAKRDALRDGFEYEGYEVTPNLILFEALTLALSAKLADEVA
mgnify:CR=1 FL=1